MQPKPKYHFDRMDAAESVFMSRQLEQIRARTYDVKYPNLKAREFVPIDNSLNPGVETVTYRQFDEVGQAKIISDYAEDAPRVDVSAKEFTSKIRGIGAAYGYSIQEARAAMYAGIPLEQRKANAARRAVEEQIDAILRLGSSKHGLVGFLNQPNASTYTIPAGAAATTPWSTKTADEIVADMHGAANAMVTNTKEVEIPDTMLIPLAQWGIVTTKRLGANADTTILDYFLKTNPYIKTVAPWFILAGAGAGGLDRMVVYRRDPDVLQGIIPQEFEQFPPEQRGMRVRTECHARCGGVVVYYPLAMQYADGI